MTAAVGISNIAKKQHEKRYPVTANPSFDLFRLPDEHNELRAVLRDLCEQEIAPHAADVDEQSRFPEEALSALSVRGVRRPRCGFGGGLHCGGGGGPR
jgi:hypothetical protein